MSRNRSSEGPAATRVVAGGGTGKAANPDELRTAIRTAPAGRLTIIAGPGQGTMFPVYRGTNSIGRSAEHNVIGLDFGDDAIHREAHAFVIVEKGTCEIAENGKPNPVRVNERVIAGNIAVTRGDAVRIGITTFEVVLD